MILYQKPKTSFTSRLMSVVFNPVLLLMTGGVITLIYFAVHDETQKAYGFWIGAVVVGMLTGIMFYNMLKASAHEIVLLELTADALKIQAFNFKQLEESFIPIKDIDVSINKHIRNSKSRDGSSTTSVSYSLSIYSKDQEKPRVVLNQPRVVLGDIIQKIKEHGAILLKNNELEFLALHQSQGRPLIPSTIVSLWNRIVLLLVVLMVGAVFVDFKFNNKKILNHLGFVFDADKQDYTVAIRSLSSGKMDTVFYLSDQGLEMSVAWKSFKPEYGRATLSDGADNILLNIDYPTAWDGMIPDSLKTTRTSRYEFTPNDKPGEWHLRMYFNDEEIVNHRFIVLAALADEPPYKKLNCFTVDGKVNLANFYQLSNDEIESLKESRGVWYWSTALMEFKKRVTICQVAEFNYFEMDNWEQWAASLSGKPVRNPSPEVHERIKAVMPIYEEEFLFVNPDFVAWFSANMIPDPNDKQVNGWVYQKMYHATQDAARSLALTYLYYLTLPNQGLDAQVQYAETMARKYINQDEERVMERNDYADVYQHVNEWHEASARRYMEDLDNSAGYIYNGADMAFWLRRGIDGSANELWLGLREVLKQYDREWYEQHINPYWAP